MAGSRPCLLDTSAWVLALRRQPSGAAIDRIDGLLEMDLVGVTPPVRTELLSGTKTDAEYSRLSERLDALVEFPVDDVVWQTAARLGFDLRRKGVTIPHIDLLIAAVAIAAEALLIHADGDFDLIAEHADLRAESLL